MSAKIMGAVFELDLPRPEKTVLLAMADHADHEGEGVRPSVDLVAWKTDYSERQVRRIQDSLRERGILVLTEDRQSQGKPNVYRIDLSAAPKKPPVNKSGGSGRPKGSAPAPGRKPRAGTEMSAPSGHPAQKPADIAMSAQNRPLNHPLNRPSLSNESGAGPAEVDLDGWTEGRIMGLWRRLHYAPDGQPPEGHRTGRDVSVIRALVKAGWSLQRIADAAEGLALARKRGQLHGATAKVTLLFCHGTQRDGRPLLEWAADYLHAAEAKTPAAAARGLVTIGQLFRGASV